MTKFNVGDRVRKRGSDSIGVIIYAPTSGVSGRSFCRVKWEIEGPCLPSSETQAECLIRPRKKPKPEVIEFDLSDGRFLPHDRIRWNDFVRSSAGKHIKIRIEVLP